MTLTQNQIRPFVWIAWLGVATTAVNTGIFAFTSAGERLVAFRDVVLLVHAPATLLPVIGVALLGFRDSPFAAVLAIVCTSLEKAVEFIGQALLVFPPEETFGGTGVGAIVRAVWDQMFFVLWCCNTVGAGAAGLLMLRLAPPRLNVAAAGLAWGAALLTLLMVLGPDYLGWKLPGPPAMVFFAVFTGYRVGLALTLAKAPRS
jgi:hypothetical protein